MKPIFDKTTISVYFSYRVFLIGVGYDDEDNLCLAFPFFMIELKDFPNSHINKLLFVCYVLIFIFIAMFGLIFLSCLM